MNNLISIKYKLNSSLFKIGEDLDLIRYSGFSFVENKFKPLELNDILFIKGLVRLAASLDCKNAAGKTNEKY